MVRPEPSLEQMLDLVGSIYETALDSGAMNVALAKLTVCLRGVASQLYTWDVASGRVLESQTESQECIAAHDRYRDYYGQLDPRTPILAQMASGAMLRCHKYCDERFVSRNEFYQDHFIPAGWRWAMGGKYDSSDGSASIIASVRELGTPAYEDWAESALKSLLPHFQRAAFLRSRIAARAADAITANGLLEALPVGCLLMDSRGRVLTQNEASAEALLDLPVRVAGGFVQFQDPSMQPAWNRAVAAVASNRIPSDLRIAGRSASSWRLHFIPCATVLQAADARDQRLVVAVFELAAASTQERVARLKAKYQLTAAEAEVLSLLLEGQPVKRIATLRQAQVSTVRSQVISLFDKTGLRSQRELIAAFGR